MEGLAVDPTVEKSARRTVPSHEDVSGREVKIRTMASDLESLAHGGGMTGNLEWKKISRDDEGASSKAPSVVYEVGEVEPQKQNSNTGLWVMILVGVAVLFLIGFFVLPLLAPK